MSLTKGLVDIGGLEAHEVRQLIDDELALGRALVHPLDAAPLPVGPVDEVAQQSETEDVWQLVLHQDPAARPIHVHHLQGEREWLTFRTRPLESHSGYSHNSHHARQHGGSGRAGLLLQGSERAHKLAAGCKEGHVTAQKSAQGII